MFYWLKISVKLSFNWIRINQLTPFQSIGRTRLKNMAVIFSLPSSLHWIICSLLTSIHILWFELLGRLVESQTGQAPGEKLSSIFWVISQPSTGHPSLPFQSTGLQPPLSSSTGTMEGFLLAHISTTRASQTRCQQSNRLPRQIIRCVLVRPPCASLCHGGIRAQQA